MVLRPHDLFPTGRLQVDLLLAEAERDPAATEIDPSHVQDTDVKVADRFDVAARDDEMIDMIDLQHGSPFYPVCSAIHSRNAGLPPATGNVTTQGQS